MASARFSTNLGLRPPRLVSQPPDPVIVRTNRLLDLTNFMSILRRKWPAECERIQNPIDVNLYFDDYDQHLHGAGFLWEALTAIVFQNTAHKENVDRFTLRWIATSPRRFREVTNDSVPSVIFTQAERDEHSNDFLTEVLNALKDKKIEPYLAERSQMARLATDSQATRTEFPPVAYAIPPLTGISYSRERFADTTAFGNNDSPVPLPVLPQPHHLDIDRRRVEGSNFYDLGGPPTPGRPIWVPINRRDNRALSRHLPPREWRSVSGPVGITPLHHQYDQWEADPITLLYGNATNELPAVTPDIVPLHDSRPFSNPYELETNNASYAVELAQTAQLHLRHPVNAVLHRGARHGSSPVNSSNPGRATNASACLENAVSNDARILEMGGDNYRQQDLASGFDQDHSHGPLSFNASIDSSRHYDSLAYYNGRPLSLGCASYAGPIVRYDSHLYPQAEPVSLRSNVNGPHTGHSMGGRPEFKSIHPKHGSASKVGGHHRRDKREDTTLWIGHLPLDVDAPAIRGSFASFGPIDDISVPPPLPELSVAEHTNRGYAFLRFRNFVDAGRAMSTMHDTLFKGQRIQVKWKDPKPTYATQHHRGISSGGQYGVAIFGNDRKPSEVHVHGARDQPDHRRSSTEYANTVARFPRKSKKTPSDGYAGRNNYVEEPCHHRQIGESGGSWDAHTMTPNEQALSAIATRPLLPPGQESSTAGDQQQEFSREESAFLSNAAIGAYVGVLEGGSSYPGRRASPLVNKPCDDMEPFAPNHAVESAPKSRHSHGFSTAHGPPNVPQYTAQDVRHSLYHQNSSSTASGSKNEKENHQPLQFDILTPPNGCNQANTAPTDVKDDRKGNVRKGQPQTHRLKDGEGQTGKAQRQMPGRKVQKNANIAGNDFDTKKASPTESHNFVRGKASKRGGRQSSPSKETRATSASQTQSSGQVAADQLEIISLGKTIESTKDAPGGVSPAQGEKQHDGSLSRKGTNEAVPAVQINQSVADATITVHAKQDKEDRADSSKLDMELGRQPETKDAPGGSRQTSNRSKKSKKNANSISPGTSLESPTHSTDHKETKGVDIAENSIKDSTPNTTKAVAGAGQETVTKAGATVTKNPKEKKTPDRLTQSDLPGLASPEAFPGLGHPAEMKTRTRSQGEIAGEDGGLGSWSDDGLLVSKVTWSQVVSRSPSQASSGRTDTTEKIKAEGQATRDEKGVTGM